MEASGAALKRLDAAGGGFMACDWRDTVFFNLAVDPAVLQPMVPYSLDLYEGQAYVSIVAFDQVRFRTTLARGIISPLIRPLGSNLFCNLRTYVRHEGEPGIHFMREWVPNPIGVVFAPPAYGLPYRLAQLRYELDRAQNLFFGRVTARGRHLTLSARIDYDAPLHVPEPGSLDDFLMERYTGFQRSIWGRVRFRIWHVPWPEHDARGEIVDDELLRATGSWYQSAQLVSANYSPGIDGVRIGLPHRI